MADSPDRTHMHPVAAQVARQFGMSRAEAEQVIRDAQDRNPMALIGGYNIDVIIVTAAATLRLEDIDGQFEEGEIDRRIQSIIEIYCTGLV